jgi:hypothetical protein
VVLLKKVWVYPARVLKQATKARCFRTESESIVADLEFVGQTFYEVLEKQLLFAALGDNAIPFAQKQSRNNRQEVLAKVNEPAFGSC